MRLWPPVASRTRVVDVRVEQLLPVDLEARYGTLPFGRDQKIGEALA